jgi:hypothetical protein
MVDIANGRVILENLDVTTNEITITATTTTLGYMTSYINALKEFEGVKSVSVEKIENKPDTGLITMALSVKFAGATEEGGASAN